MHDTDIPAVGSYEPSLQATFLPRCPTCSGKHPLAYQPPMDPNTCPNCGAHRAPVGPAIDVPATITDRRTKFGNLLLRIGISLSRLQKRM